LRSFDLFPRNVLEGFETDVEASGPTAQLSDKGAVSFPSKAPSIMRLDLVVDEGADPSRRPDLGLSHGYKPRPHSRCYPPKFVILTV
jgi:hypothetical protein